MLKNLFIFIGRLITPAPPTALQAMKASLRESEMQYLRTLDAQEYHACQAAMKAVEVQHDFRRCKRLEKFIDQEQRAQYEASAESFPSCEEIEMIIRDMSGVFDFLGKKEVEPEQDPIKKDAKQGPTPPPEANAHTLKQGPGTSYDQA